ncbi:MAG TPA: ATP-dependent DNA helicase, partial [Clostridiales bacterium]|nr:ATP-dependent DNA helicase [Clostridiales bacterium]
MLSSDQMTAVQHMEGPAMVLAGPGSGKTMVITNRIYHLISRGVRPENILVITFTRAAARQMQQRFERLTAPEHFRVTFGTFHAVFFQILKNAYGYTAQSILRDDERYRIITSIA